jgi:hypothetical protein
MSNSHLSHSPTSRKLSTIPRPAASNDGKRPGERGVRRPTPISTARIPCSVFATVRCIRRRCSASRRRLQTLYFSAEHFKPLIGSALDRLLGTKRRSTFATSRLKGSRIPRQGLPGPARRSDAQSTGAKYGRSATSRLSSSRTSPHKPWSPSGTPTCSGRCANRCSSSDALFVV